MSNKLPFDREDYDLSASQLDDKYNPDGEGEHPHFTRDDWRDDVAAENTLLGYWDWLSHQIILEVENEDENE